MRIGPPAFASLSTEIKDMGHHKWPSDFFFLTFYLSGFLCVSLAILELCRPGSTWATTA